MRYLQVLFITLLLSTGTVMSQPVQSPMIYEFPYLCPSCNEEMIMSIRTGSDGTSILETHSVSSTPMLDPSYDSEDYLPGQLVFGPITNGDVGNLQNWEREIGSNFIEVREEKFPEEGVRYVDEDLTKVEDQPESGSWSISDLSVSVEDGNQDRTIKGFEADHQIATVSYMETSYDEEGTETSNKGVKYELHVWLSENMPFSPLPFQYEPFKENRVPPYNYSPIDDLVVSRLLQKIRGDGGLVASKLVYEDEEWSVDMNSVRQAPPPPMQKLETLPVVSSDQVDNFAGPLFIVSLLRDGELQSSGSGTIEYNGREIPANSAWKVNDSGDLVIVISGKNENTTFFLVRPITGKPNAGTYDVTQRPESSSLRNMSSEQITEHSRDFQIYGLISESGFPTVVSGFQSGSVTIEESSEATITGISAGNVNALPTNDLSQTNAVSLKLSFKSENGLENFQFTSPEARLSQR